MSQQFNEVRVGTTQRSTFSLSHHQVMTSDFGHIVPICYRDMVPNDNFVVTPKLFCRLAPPSNPFYGKITVRVHNFFVPYRILFDKFDAFLTGSTNTTPPYALVSSFRQYLDQDKQFTLDSQPPVLEPRGTFGRLISALGLNAELLQSQSGLGDNDRISLFPLLAYYRIWLDYFMDSNINDHATEDLYFKQYYCKGGAISQALLEDLLRTRVCCFGKDYFTTAKIHPQAGADPSLVGVDLGVSVNPGLDIPITSSANITKRLNGSVGLGTGAAVSGQNSMIGQFTVEELRAATSLQRYLERNNYVGTQIRNQLLAHFGIVPPAERLDMAEYIGGSNFGVQIGDVTATANATDESPNVNGIGAMAGKGIAAASTKTVRYHAKEHGIFMSVMSILPDAAYYQGISRFWHKGVSGDRFDFYTPEFENLGYQEILNREVYIPSDQQGDGYQTYDPKGIFGYTPRYSEYKFQYDVLAGDFVGNLAAGISSVMGGPMDAWHLFRKMIYSDQSPLVLNNNFVECNRDNNDFDRVFQVTSQELDHFYFNIDVDVKATRPMVGFAEPSLESVNNQNGQKMNLPYGGTRL